jgi:hypothetical protein
MSKKGVSKSLKKVPASPEPFDRNKHVYANHDFVELVKDAVRFFNGTPVHRLPPPERFLGTGIYALYYTGQSQPYAKYAELNRLAYDFPIYLGKAVPKGWRQARTGDCIEVQSAELHTRLREHARSIEQVDSSSLEDFSCRFMIFEGASSDMIGTIEASVIKWKKPLWNTFLDGFGNHDPGKGRYQQAKSDWDVVHVGRSWAKKCKGKTPSRLDLLKGIENFLTQIGAVDSLPMDPSGGGAFSQPF